MENLKSVNSQFVNSLINNNMSDFQQTVDLRDKMEKQRRSARSAASPIEKIYQETSAEATKKELQKINRPLIQETRMNPWLIRIFVLILGIFVVGFTIYGLFFKDVSWFKNQNLASSWYAVKLVNGEVFYGQIVDTKADPVVMVNVYYNYDQDKDNKKEITETSSLRLVKRGKETHGPAGTMDIVRSHVLFMEPLKDDSKVLKAILEYEK